MGVDAGQYSDQNGSETVCEGQDAIDYLEQMGLSLKVLQDGLVAGDVLASNVSTYAPRTAAGMLRWATTVEVCRREITTHHDWSQNDANNRPTAVATSGLFTLSFVGGNSATGMTFTGASPEAARSKGPATARSVSENALFPMSTLNMRPPVSAGSLIAPAPGNWVLLYHRDEEGIRWEVSLPAGFQHGQFTGWSVRLVMPLIGRDTVTQNIPDMGGDDVEFWIA